MSGQKEMNESFPMDQSIIILSCFVNLNKRIGIRVIGTPK
jgi:hypothetical protein